MMRPFNTVAALGAAALAIALVPSVAGAYPASLKCSDSKKVDCIEGEVIVLNSMAQVNNRPLVPPNCTSRTITTGVFSGKTVRLCQSTTFQADVTARIKQFLTENNLKAKYDQVVIFTADYNTSLTAGVLYLPEGNRGPNAVNEVKNNGLPFKERVAGQPWAGAISMGDTTDFGLFATPRFAPPEGSTYFGRDWPEPNPEGVPGLAGTFQNCGANSLCYSASGVNYNGYQALAQATAQAYGPFLKPHEFNQGYLNGEPQREVKEEDPDAGVPLDDEGDGGVSGGYPRIPNNLTVFPLQKSNTATTANSPPLIFTWNSFLDMDGTLMAGSNWRENGNRSISTAGPTPHWASARPC